MNLIEQLGGYIMAKEYLRNLELIPLHEQSEDTITYLPEILLEYRRQHNIFEVGDLIVLPYTNYRRDTFELTEIFKKSCDEMGIAYRHATDGEIKVGHRL